MDWLLIFGIVFVLLFGFVIAFGPPYLPTLTRQTAAALDLLDLQRGQTLLELGSGDGRVLRAAARRGWQVVGVELNPLLVLISYLVTWRYRKQVRIIWGNIWQVTWPPADAVFTFLLPKYMSKLDAHIQKWHTKQLYLASFAFTIPSKKPVAQQGGVFLYKYD